MKVAIITDQHFGVKKGSKIYHDYFQRFYDEVFFQIEENFVDDIDIDQYKTTGAKGIVESIQVHIVAFFVFEVRIDAKIWIDNA